MASKQAAAAILKAISREYGVEIVPTTAQRAARQTHAGRTLLRVCSVYGEGHLRDVLTSILESENNAFALVAPVILAVSDVLDAHRRWYERDAGAWLEVFDQIDLLQLHENVKANQRAVSPRAAIATVIFNELAQAFGDALPPPRLVGGSITMVAQGLPLSLAMVAALGAASADDPAALPGRTRRSVIEALRRRGLVMAHGLALTPEGRALAERIAAVDERAQAEAV